MPLYRRRHWEWDFYSFWRCRLERVGRTKGQFYLSWHTILCSTRFTPSPCSHTQSPECSCCPASSQTTSLSPHSPAACSRMTRCTCYHCGLSWIPSLCMTRLQECPQLSHGLTTQAILRLFVICCLDYCTSWAPGSVVSYMSWSLLDDECLVVQSLTNFDERSRECFVDGLLYFPIWSSLPIDNIYLLESLHLLVLDYFPNDEAKINLHGKYWNIKSSIYFEAPIVNSFHLLFVIEWLFFIFNGLGSSLHFEFVEDVAERWGVYFNFWKKELFYGFGSWDAGYLFVYLRLCLLRQNLPIWCLRLVLAV